MPERIPAEQFETMAHQTHAARLGMWVFMGSETLLFAGLFTLYAAYKAMYPVDFAAAAGHSSLAIGTANTFILITSSLTVALSVYAIRISWGRLAGVLLVLTIVMGGVFLTLKGIEYAAHFHEGIYPGPAYAFAAMPAFGARMFFTLYYLLTGLHALHVVAGMVILGVIARGAFRGHYSAAWHTPLELGGLYWHLVDIVWIFLWPLLYLAHA